MKAIQITHSQELNVIELEKPQAPSQGEVLLKLHYVGFCGSDINTFMGRNTMALNPVIPGHEVGAVIEAVGAGVPDSLKPGMVVTCNPYTNCGKCASCRNRRVNACQHNETLGVQRNGAEVTDIDVVMVIGCGMVGMGAIVRAALRGATVIAADIDDEKLALAKKMGAAYTLNTKTEDAHQRLQEITNGFGPDVVIEAVGSVPTYQMAINEVAFTGRVACIGYAKSEVSLQTKYFVQKELDIRGSRNALPTDFLAVIHYLETNDCPIDTLITKVIKPEEGLDTMRWWSENPGKVFRILVNFAD